MAAIFKSAEHTFSNAWPAAELTNLYARLCGGGFCRPMANNHTVVSSPHFARTAHWLLCEIHASR
jgi:hypothetical protein